MKDISKSKLGIALCIGLNSVSKAHYQGWSGVLNACEEDARDMAQIAAQNGFTTTILLTKQATRRAIITALKKASDTLKEGDSFLISYSGHGGQVPDKNGDEEDGKDETWCLYDGQFIDDELFYVLSKFAKGVKIVVLSDSCHSGTMLKDMYNTPQAKSMPFNIGIRTYTANKPLYDGLTKNKAVKNAKGGMQASCLLISGCQDNQYSLDGKDNGLFTGTLLKVYNNGKFNGTYRQLYKQIMRSMPPSQTPNFYLVGDPSIEAHNAFTI